MRLTSDCDVFPFGYPGMVCYFEVHETDLSEHVQAHTRDDLRAATRRAVAGASVLYAVWPGQYRSDLFRVDNPEVLAEKIKA